MTLKKHHVNVKPKSVKEANKIKIAKYKSQCNICTVYICNICTVYGNYKL